MGKRKYKGRRLGHQELLITWMSRIIVLGLAAASIKWLVELIIAY